MQHFFEILMLVVLPVAILTVLFAVAYARLIKKQSISDHAKQVKDYYMLTSGKNL